MKKTNNSYSGALPALTMGRVWGHITQKLTWIWRVCAAALIIAGVVLITAGCDTPPHQLLIIDVSTSTGKAQDEYLNLLKTSTNELALKKGTLDVLFIGGDIAESKLMSHTFFTDENGDYGRIDLLNQASTVTNQVEYLLKHPTIKNTYNTALLRSFVLAASQGASNTKGPFEILVFSDGIENSSDFSMYSSKLDDATINSTLDRLQADDLIPRLSGASIHFIEPHYHPDSSDGAPDELKVKRFWELWSQRAGATNLTWEQQLSEETS